MKLILVSDLHLVAPGEKLFGFDPLSNLEACIESINAEHADADLVVFCGDITNDGLPAAYAAAAEKLKALRPPFRIVPGNHDDRAALIAAFPEAASGDGFTHAAIDAGGKRLLLLDTLWPGHVDGQLCDQRLAWTDRELGKTSDALVVMHHPPFEIGVASMDDCRLTDPDRLLEIFKRHGNVRHIFAGHVHIFASGHWGGIPFTTLRSTNHQSALAFSGPHRVSFEPPAYHIVLSTNAGIVVHMREFEARR